MLKLFVLLGLLSMAAHAGPPLICHPYDIGSAQSLPWGPTANTGWDNPDPNYDTRKLSADTLALLSPHTPVLIHKETIRRAAIYGAKDQDTLTALVANLRQRANDESNALAVFDYGYMLATMKQLEWRYKRDLTGGVNGSVLVSKAVGMNHDPEMQSAVPLIAAWK